MQAVHCPCGATVEAETDDELVTNVEQHISEKHPTSSASIRVSRSWPWHTPTSRSCAARSSRVTVP